MFTRPFWIGAADRAVKSFASQLGLVLLADHVLNLFRVDWVTDLGMAGGAAVISLIMSVGSAPVGNQGTTSLLPGGS